MEKQPKIYLCAFANLNLSTSAYRFYHQALQMGIFEDIFIYNETTLSLDFTRHFKDKFYENAKTGGHLTMLRVGAQIHFCWAKSL